MTQHFYLEVSEIEGDADQALVAEMIAQVLQAELPWLEFTVELQS